MRVTVELNMANINAIEKQIQKGLYKVADKIKEDIDQSETMPFKTGALAERSFFISTSSIDKGEVRLVSGTDDTPYARRLYFHPEYNFSREFKKNPGGKWFEPYISGTKKDYAQKVFTQFMRGGK